MRSKLLGCFVLLCLLLAALPSASAQDEIVSCTEDELASGVETLGENFATFLALGEISTDLTLENYRDLAVAYEALAFEHWTEVMPSLPQCAELNITAYIYGRIYDDALNVVLLRWHALYEADNGDAEYAEAFLAAAETRNEELSGTIAGVGEMAGVFTQLVMGEFPCTEEQAAEYEALFAEYAEYYQILASDITTEDVASLADYIVGFESSEVAFSDAYGEMVCSDTVNSALGLSSIYSDSLAVVLISRTALIEDEMGDSDVAAHFYEQAAARAEIVQATAESMASSME